MIDWNKCALAFDDKAAKKLCAYRGYSDTMVGYLRDKRLVGLYQGNIAFPTNGGAHYKTAKGWAYTDGSKPSPFILGNIENGSPIHCFESQWCAIAFSDASGERDNVVATRGAGNARLISDLINNLCPTRTSKIADVEPESTGQNTETQSTHQAGRGLKEIGTEYAQGKDSDGRTSPKENLNRDALTAKSSCQHTVSTSITRETKTISLANGAQPRRPSSTEKSQSASSYAQTAIGKDISTLYVWPQNDAPGRKWAEDIRKLLPDVPIKVATVPIKYKDLQEWVKAEGHEAKVMDAYNDAKDLPMPEKGGDASCQLTEVPLSGNQTEAGFNAAPIVQPAGAAGTLAHVLNDTETFFLRYVRFPEPWHVTVCSLWVVYTWIWQAFDRTPYLLIRGPEENCGKTRVLDCLLAIAPSVFGGQVVAGASEASLFHEINESKPVLLLDEIDENFANGEDDPIVRVINAGYRRGGTVMRWNIRTNRPDKYDIFCPKAFAGIGTNIKPTVSSRCIHIHMARQPSGDMAAPFRESKVANEVRQIRTFLLAWSSTAVNMLRGVEPALPEELANDGRKAEITEPLIAVADMAGAEWAERAREDLICAFDQPKDDSEGTKLLKSIKNIFLNRSDDKIHSHQLVELLVSSAEDDVPWPSWWERDLAKGQWHAAAGKVSRMLKQYRIHSKNVRVGDEQAKGYDRADFDKAWKAYVKSETKAETLELGLVA